MQIKATYFYRDRFIIRCYERKELNMLISHDNLILFAVQAELLDSMNMYLFVI